MSFEMTSAMAGSTSAYSPASLTEAEARVAALMIQGLDNAEIADQLCLSLNTVKKYVSRVMEKLEARNRTHAVVLMLRR